MIRTVRYDLPYDESLIKTINVGVDVFQFWSDLAVEHKTSGKFELHHLGYYKARELFPSFNSMLILTVRDNVSEARKSIRSRTGERNPLLKGHKGRGLRYNDHCFTMWKDGTLSLATVDGRKKYKVVPAPQYADWNAKSVTLKVSAKGCHIHVQYEMLSPSVKEWSEDDVLGIDRGVKNIIACSDNTFINSKHLRNIKGKYLYARSQCQSKGTRSSKRRFNALSGRERRFVRDVNHCISKDLVASSYGVFALEEPKNIRKNSVKGRIGKTVRKMIGGWSFTMLAQFIEYKAEAEGKRVIYVPPNFTSQKCSVCGHTLKSNRKGSYFNCKACGFTLNADLNASRNIAHLGKSLMRRVISQPPVCSSRKRGRSKPASSEVGS